MVQGLIKLANPNIIKQEGHQEVVEGCLSIPNKWGKLVRPTEVTIQVLDENGQEIILAGTGEFAKCLCHEIDHLDGILFTDLVTEYLNDAYYKMIEIKGLFLRKYCYNISIKRNAQ